MSEYTSTITIEPPLNWAEIRKVTEAIRAHALENKHGSKYTKEAIRDADTEAVRAALGFGLEIATESIETDEGRMMAKSAAALSYYTSEGCSYLLNEGVWVEKIAELAPGHSLNGTLVYVNDEATAGTKTIVEDSKMRFVEGKTHMVWDDGTSQKVSEIY